MVIPLDAFRALNTNQRRTRTSEEGCLCEDDRTSGKGAAGPTVRGEVRIETLPLSVGPPGKAQRDLKARGLKRERGTIQKSQKTKNKQAATTTTKSPDSSHFQDIIYQRQRTA